MNFIYKFSNITCMEYTTFDAIVNVINESNMNIFNKILLRKIYIDKNIYDISAETNNLIWKIISKFAFNIIKNVIFGLEFCKVTGFEYYIVKLDVENKKFNHMQNNPLII